MGKATDGSEYPKYQFEPNSITLFKTTMRVPPFGDSIRAYPSVEDPSLVFAETGDQESPAYYRTGSGISAGAERASRLRGLVQKLGSRNLQPVDIKSWQTSTLQLSLKKYCLAQKYMLTNTMFPNRFYGLRKGGFAVSQDSKVCGSMRCSMGNIFEAQCEAVVDKADEIEKLINPQTSLESEVRNWLSIEDVGNDCSP